MALTGAHESAEHSGARLWEWLLILGVIAADQLTKLAVVLELDLHENLPIIAGVLDVTHVRNTGAAFGFLNTVEFPGKAIAIAVVAFIALMAVAAYAMHLPPSHRLARFGLLLILGGAAGNLVDRLRQGYVIDFVDAYWRDWHFWAFNVADAAITVGVTIIILDLLRPVRHGVPGVQAESE
jgi:signal peptidase II